jgi:acyl-coenzyme A synthetase/AMP-(fatty) acid ligase
LKSVGVGKGDAVVIYLPMLMELPIAMLACARIGAVHSVTANPHVCKSTVLNGYMYV